MIFIGGVHGVGKTYICHLLKEDIAVYSASELIEEYRKISYSGYKKIHHIKENQHYLVNAVTNKEKKREPFILNGHFCLFNAKGNIERIPYEIFKKLNIQGIILLYGEEKVIEERIKKRDSNSDTLTIKEITQLQEQEIKYANFVANGLKVPITLINCNDPNIIANCKNFIHTITEK